MKTMYLRLFGLAAVISLFMIQLPGQDRPRPGAGPGGGPGRGFQLTEEDIRERVDNLAETLEFSEDQHKKIMQFELEFYNKMQVERQKMRNNADGNFNREVWRETMRKNREERDKRYKEVLTPAQLDRFNEIREQRRSEMRRQYQEGSPDGQGERPARGRSRN
jgi:hypothetical protein